MIEHYSEALPVLNNIPEMFLKVYLEEHGYIVRKAENKPKFNDDFYKV